MNTPVTHPQDGIVIVGGGISGLSIAVRLSESGLPVTVLESGYLGNGSSSRNQGWLYSGAWFAPRQPALARACHESLKQTIDLCDECLEPATPSMIYLFSSPSTPVSYWTDAWEAAEIPYRPVSVEEAVAETGVTGTIVRHAFRLPDRAIQTNVLLAFLTAKAEHQGVEIRTRAPVNRLIRVGDEIRGVVYVKWHRNPGAAGGSGCQHRRGRPLALYDHKSGLSNRIHEGLPEGPLLDGQTAGGQQPILHHRLGRF